MTTETPPTSAATSFQRCPVWVPQNPDVPHNDRLHCILPSNHQERMWATNGSRAYTTSTT